MAASESKEERRSNGMEMFVISIIAMLVVTIVVSMYYQYPWYYALLYFYKTFAYLPEAVNKWMFYWVDNAQSLIPLMHDDLVFHASDFSSYYVDNEKGVSKRHQMNFTALKMFAPYVGLFVLYNIFKELRRVKSPIKGLGDRRKGSALYMYAKSQADIWVYIKPIVNIMKEMVEEKNLDKGWYALSEIPLAWMKRKDLLRVVKTKKRKRLLTVREREEFTLDLKNSYLALRENLGPVWPGLDNLDFNYRCVLAVVVPHVFGRIEMSRLINRKLCNYHESNKSKEDKAKEPELLKEITEDVDRILDMHKEAFVKPYFDDEEFEDPFDPILSSFEELDSEQDMFNKGKEMVKDTLLRHSYQKTVLFGLIERAWVYGVLASAELLWVKKVDRELWYVLSQQGRTSAFVEVCGAWSHYLSEESYGFRTLMPQLEEGIRSLDFDLWQTHDNVIPHEQWEDQGKWDKLVPDAVGKGSQMAKPPKGSDTSKVV